MKKLGKLTINPEKVINNEELINLRGGTDYTTGTCGAYLPNGETGYGINPGDTWAGSSYEVNNGANIYRGVSKEFALAITQGVTGAKWCCDSCSQTSWY